MTPAPVKAQSEEIDFGPLESAYPFSQPDTEETILFDENSESIEAATLNKLVERLTFEKNPDQKYVRTFLLTYNSFTTPLQLMDLLIARYDIPNPKKSDSKLLQEFENRKVKPIRLRTFNAIKHWVNHYPKDFASNKTLTNKLRFFLENKMAKTGMENPAKLLLKSLDSAVSGEAKKKEKKNPKNAPAPLLPKTTNFAEMEISDIPPEEFARQMTLLDFEAYLEIEHTELTKASALTRFRKNSPNFF